MAGRQPRGFVLSSEPFWLVIRAQGGSPYVEVPWNTVNSNWGKCRFILASRWYLFEVNWKFCVTSLTLCLCCILTVLQKVFSYYERAPPTGVIWMSAEAACRFLFPLCTHISFFGCCYFFPLTFLVVWRENKSWNQQGDEKATEGGEHERMVLSWEASCWCGWGGVGLFLFSATISETMVNQKCIRQTGFNAHF